MIQRRDLSCDSCGLLRHRKEYRHLLQDAGMAPYTRACCGVLFVTRDIIGFPFVPIPLIESGVCRVAGLVLLPRLILYFFLELGGRAS